MSKEKIMSLEAAAAFMTKQDLRQYLLFGGVVLAGVARMTKTKKDDAGAALFNGLVLDDEKFG